MKRAIILFGLIALLSAPPAIAQLQSELPIKLQNFVETLELEKNDLQGGAIAILYKGLVVYKTTFGKQKGDSGTITSSTLFPLASGSKTVSAAAIALMVDKGVLNLEEKFKLPYLKNQVNLFNILSHTTGYQFTGNAEIEKGMTRSKLLNILQKQQPKCKPGQCHWYSNAIFSLVEEALNRKKLSLKMALDNLRAVLEIEGMEIAPLASDADIAYPHSRKIINGEEIITPLPLPPYYPKLAPASAGIFASIDGMIEIFKLCFGYRPDLISQQTLDIMYTPVKSTKSGLRWELDWPVDKKMIELYYTLGWRLLRIKDRPEKDFIFHPGFINGINSFIGYMPSEEIGIIILLNQRSNFHMKNGIKFWGEFLN